MTLDANVKKSFKGFRLDMEFGINNEIAVLLGRSGAGKSLTLQCISGILSPDSGKVELNGSTVFDSEKGINVPLRKRRIGYLFQNFALFPHMNALDNVAYGSDKTKAKKILEEFNLSYLEKKFPAEMSGGEQQRVALARAIASEPKLLLLDEPLNALDASAKWSLVEVIKEVQKKHEIPVLYVTHDFTEAMALGNRIGVIEKGKLIQFGTREEVFYKPKNLEVAELVGVENIFNARLLSSSDEESMLDLGVKVKVEKKVNSDSSLLCIRPEDIMLIRKERPSRFENFYKGRIKDIEAFGSAMFKIFVELEENKNLTFTILIPRHVKEKMELKEGREVEISLKKEKIHVIENV